MGHVEPGRKAGRPKKAEVIVAATVALLSLAIAWVTPAVGDECAGKQRSILPSPGWKLAQYYPYGAQVRGDGGWTVMQCRATGDGRVEACTVTKEKPHGLGFGDAALKLARYYRVRGFCPGETVVIPISWRLR
jgi:hypothetical protein